MTGTYTINPAGGDFLDNNFKTFQEAIDSLHSLGVSGHVVFNVADGIYNERVTINQISGAAADSTITFQSQSLDSTGVELTYLNTDNSANWTLRLNGADYIILRKMRLRATGDSYSRVININGNADNNIIENCQLWGTPPGGLDYSQVVASFNDQVENNTFRNNYFFSGSYGIYMLGIDKNTLSSGTHIHDNIFVDQTKYGLSLEFHDAPIVENNTVESSGSYGIHMEDCYNELEIRNNLINMNNGSQGAINLDWCFGNTMQKGLVKITLSLSREMAILVGVYTLMVARIKIFIITVLIFQLQKHQQIQVHFFSEMAVPIIPVQILI